MKSYIHDKKKIVAFLFSLGLSVGVLVFAFIAPFGVEIAYAQTPPTTTNPLKIVGKFLLDLVFTAGDWTIGMIFSGIMQATFTLSGYLVKLGGYLLEISIENALRPDNYVVEAVRGGWEIIRNVANLTFIFILLYIAIRTILRLEKDTKQLL